MPSSSSEKNCRRNITASLSEHADVKGTIWRPLKSVFGDPAKDHDPSVMGLIKPTCRCALPPTWSLTPGDLDVEILATAVRRATP